MAEPSSGSSTRPRFTAQAAICARVLKPSLFRMFWRCASAVRPDTTRVVALSRFCEGMVIAWSLNFGVTFRRCSMRMTHCITVVPGGGF